VHQPVTADVAQDKRNETRQITEALDRVAPDWKDTQLAKEPRKAIDYLMQCLTQKADLAQFE